MNLFSPDREGPQKEKLRNETDRVPRNFYLNGSWENIFQAAMMQIVKKEWREGPSWVSFIWPFSELFPLLWSRERMKLGNFLMHQCLTKASFHSTHHLFAGNLALHQNIRENLPHGHKFRWTLKTTDRHIRPDQHIYIHKRSGQRFMYFHGDLWSNVSNWIKFYVLLAF